MEIIQKQKLSLISNKHLDDSLTDACKFLYNLFAHGIMIRYFICMIKYDHVRGNHQFIRVHVCVTYNQLCSKCLNEISF